MKSYLGFLLLLFCSFFQNLKAQDYTALKHQFSISPILSNIHYGFSLYDLDRNEYVFGIKEDQHFTPASNTKVFTLFSSLEHIGDSIPGIQYKISGDSLLFFGTGDPTFLHPKLDNRRVYDFLKNSNKKLYYVKQTSSEPSYRNGWSIEDFQEYYQPDISTFPIYGNVVHFYGVNNSIKAKPDYFEHYLSAGEHASIKPTIARDAYSNNFVHSKSAVQEGFKTDKPFIWSDTLLVKLLQDTLHKEVKFLTNYPKPKDLQTLYSVPRNVVLRDMMLPSDNFLAEQLTMAISSLKYASFSTEKLRSDMYKDYYSRFQDSIILRDGSGLSTYNKVTPRSMVELLTLIKNSIPNEDRRFLFFPAGGIDGTLKAAYKLDLEVPFVFAKTGTINSVHAQSGYLVTRSGKRLAFSFLNNNYVVPTSEVRNEMVRIMTFIRQNY